VARYVQCLAQVSPFLYNIPEVHRINILGSAHDNFLMKTGSVVWQRWRKVLVKTNISMRICLHFHLQYNTHKLAVELLEGIS